MGIESAATAVSMARTAIENIARQKNALSALPCGDGWADRAADGTADNGDPAAPRRLRGLRRRVANE
ncbi:hypothetical protein [Acidovorax sp. SUPP3334]|uniref:hypothetical protein n=1 Tax=Acidovorax sp. SUPP3334 TaxID=2920881 RepID=UPI0024E047D2|nr:hypothetical protein [Acidovorax sp. SUPP3334]